MLKDVAKQHFPRSWVGFKLWQQGSVETIAKDYVAYAGFLRAGEDITDGLKNAKQGIFVDPLWQIVVANRDLIIHKM